MSWSVWPVPALLAYLPIGYDDLVYVSSTYTAPAPKCRKKVLLHTSSQGRAVSFLEKNEWAEGLRVAASRRRRGVGVLNHRGHLYRPK